MKSRSIATKDRIKENVQTLKKYYTELGTLVQNESMDIEAYLSVMRNACDLLKEVNRRVNIGKAMANAGRQRPSSPAVTSSGHGGLQ